jgi:hypothetical protein
MLSVGIVPNHDNHNTTTHQPHQHNMHVCLNHSNHNNYNNRNHNNNNRKTVATNPDPWSALANHVRVCFGSTPINQNVLPELIGQLRLN